MTYSLGTAAKAAGISKTTIHRAIKSGKLSAIRHEDGSYEIDPAELHRVYPPGSQGNSSSNHDLEQTETLNETGVLRREVELLRERMADKDGVIADLRRRLDAEAEERRKLTALLTDQRATRTTPVSTAERPKGWRGLLTRLAEAKR